MKTNNTYKIAASFVAIMILSVSAFSQVMELNKTIKKSFKILPESNVQISNKYGNIHIVPTETDSVRFEIEIKVTDKQAEKATKLLNGIDVQFNNSPYYIIAKTVFADYKGSVWSNISDMASTAISGGNKVEINWVVYIPESTELKIENKFGSIYTTNHTGKFSIDLSNGDFQANNLSGDTKLKMAFGKAHLNTLLNATLDLNYIELDLKNAIKLDVLSKSSEVRMPSINEMYLNSRRDNYIIDSINTIKGETNFSTIKFRKTIKDVMLNVKYGNLSFDELSINLKYFNIISAYADIYITVNKEFSGKVDITYRKSILALPDIFNALSKTLSNTETQEYNSKGIVGPEKPDSTDFKLNLNQGSLSVGIR